MKNSYIVFFILVPFLSFSQIKGKVLNEKTLEPIPYASIQFKPIGKDSLELKGIICDSVGKFNVNIKSKLVKVKIRCLGFKDSTFILDLNVEELIIIKLKENANNLSEIIVKGERPLFERRADRLVMNIQGQVKSSSVFEIISKSPNIIFTPNEGLTMYGKSGVRIMIDEKPIYLSGPSLMIFLKSLNPADIDKIEFISSPSVEFDAQGSAGIINIITKRESREGMSGLAYMESLWGAYHSINLGGQFGYRTKKVSLKFGYSFQPVPTFEKSNTDRFLINSKVLQNDFAEVKGINHSFKFNLLYFISKKSEIGIDIKSNFYKESITQTNESYLFKNESLDNLNITETNFINRNNNLSVSANYSNNLNTKGKRFSVDFDNIFYSINRAGGNIINYYDSNKRISSNPFQVVNNQPNNVLISTIKSDMSIPTPLFNIKFGIKSSFVENKSDFNFFAGKVGSAVFDTLRSNNFKYNENVNSAYLKLSKTFKKGDYNLGLRAENTNILLNEKNSSLQNSYTNFFPNFSVNYKLDSLSFIGGSYSRRIGRPYFQDLTPFLYYVSPFQSIQGNPSLQPQITNTIQLNYTYDNRYTINFLSDFASNVLSSVPYVNQSNSETVIQKVNLLSMNNFILELLLPVKFSKNWSANISCNIFKKRYESILQGLTLINQQTGFRFSGNTTFKFLNGFQFELSGYYISPFADGVYRTNALYTLDIGIKKTLFKRYDVSLLLQDALKTYKVNSSLETPFQKIESNQRFNTNIFSISVVYRFNKGLKVINKYTDKLDESKRIK